jgi:ATP-binding protein involved in chromosome partitioning
VPVVKIPFLGRIPISEPIRIGGDSGVPIVLSDPNAPASEAFQAAAEQTAAQISIHRFRTPMIPLTLVN